MFERITMDLGNSVSMKFLSDKSLFRMTSDESLTLLFAPTCKIMFDGERSKYGFRKSAMSSMLCDHGSSENPEFGFTHDSLFSSIS